MFDLKGIDRRLMPYAKVFQQGNGFALGVNISPYYEVHVTLYHAKCVNPNYILCDRVWVFPFFSTDNRSCVFKPSVDYKQTFDYDRMRYADTFKINLRKLNKHKDVISLAPPFRLFNKIKIVIYFLLRRRFWYTPNDIYNNLMEYMIWMDEIQSQIKKIINSHEHPTNA